ncbi:MAG: adenylate or guanylate cyclase [Algoriphagus marincola HL-49]|uniref:Adenylate or guanylate cyclase n=1 Tax=Algoriphagus marincola HL-49 TaxID=1305737 RepID=A0A0P8C8M0_9BACT|nr:MAG: adenylate or guanylate cyclase [Algoriphagus marincola HL-49]
MPNLKHLARIKEKYPDFNKTLSSKETQLIIEAFDPSKIEKGFSFNDGKIQEYIEFFKERKKVDVVLLFIDITSFSEKFQKKSPDEVAKILDDYYSVVIPIINFCGGEIEKIIGDGLIAVFGEPFLKSEKVNLHLRAEKCAITIISKLKDTEYESKVALHFGEVLYYQNESIDYSDFTIVGKTLTELFRLESVSYSNSINFFSSTYFEEKNIADVRKSSLKITENEAKWFLSEPKRIDLKGVDYTEFRWLKYEP